MYVHTNRDTQTFMVCVYECNNFFKKKNVMNLEENKVMEVHGRFGREKKKRRGGDAIIM